MSDAGRVRVAQEGPVGLCTLDRPQALNALSMPLMKELLTALEAFDKASDVRAMIVAGTARAFAAGADINELKELGSSAQAKKALGGHLGRWDKIGKLQKPVIAAVSGFALGGGCELALACDIVIAAEDAVFGQPEILIGVIPGAGGTQRLTRIVGNALAMDMALTGRRLNAREALAAGLVSRVVAPEALLDEARKVAKHLAGLSPLALRAAKQAVLAAKDNALADGLMIERDAFYELFDSQDQKEGMRAFVEKRAPAFSGK